MEKLFLSAVVILMSEAVSSNNNFREIRFRYPENRHRDDFYEQGMSNDNLKFYSGSDEVIREDRGLVKELQPLCREIRTEISAAVFVPHIANAEIYTFRPQKIYMVNCSKEATDLEVGVYPRMGCWPQNCREKYVDIDIFGKPKTVKENLWQLLMEIPSVPIACECFKML